jgi:hypothetical protein
MPRDKLLYYYYYTKKKPLNFDANNIEGARQCCNISLPSCLYLSNSENHHNVAFIHFRGNFIYPFKL